MLFMGLDVGTQGARCCVTDEKGAIAASRAARFARLNSAKGENRFEQSPADWLAASEQAIAECAAEIKKKGFHVRDIASLSVDGTSGTVVPVDINHSPLRDAIMYNDPRARDQAARVHEAMRAHEQKLGLRFGSSFSLPRILWIIENEPEIAQRTKTYLHQADYILGALCGEFNLSDYSNALKTGYDLIDRRWPDEIEKLGVPIEKLPRVAAPGAPVGRLTKAAADRLGLDARTLVTGGSTDGYASALSAGAVRPGDWASIIGTTFVLKGVTERLIIDPSGSSYSHRLPSGAWLLGGASNAGGRCLNAFGEDLLPLDRDAESLIPTGARCYPLSGVGERFPFVDPNARPFYIGPLRPDLLYPALLEGMGFVEKMALDKMARSGCTVGDTISTTGGACRSAIWLRIRASILNKRLRVPVTVDAAMGSALLAASRSFGSLESAADSMIRCGAPIDPDEKLVQPYQEQYEAFRRDCARLYGKEADA